MPLGYEAKDRTLEINEAEAAMRGQVLRSRKTWPQLRTTRSRCCTLRAACVYRALAVILGAFHEMNGPRAGEMLAILGQ